MNANNNNELIKKLAFETIDGKYSKALYGDFTVTMDMTNGYINATKLCADGGKRFDNWLQNKGNKEMVKCFESHILEFQDMKITVTGGQTLEIRGTYVHPDLIPHIASWVSPAFAYKVSKIVNNFLIREKEAEIERLTGAKTRLELMLEESNRERRAHEERAEKMLQDMKDQNDKAHVKLDEVNHKLDKAENDIEELQIEVEQVSARIDIVIDEVVNPANRFDIREGFGVIKLNDPKSKYGYKSYCAQNKNIGKSLKKIRVEFPNATMFREINPNPNSKNILHKLKELYGCKGAKSKIKIHYSYITLLNGVSEDELNVMIDNVVENAKNYGVCGVSP
jgi:hypothetical protein